MSDKPRAPQDPQTLVTLTMPAERLFVLGFVTGGLTIIILVTITIALAVLYG